MKIVVFDDNINDLDLLLQIIQSWEELREHTDIITLSFQDFSALDFALQDISMSDVFFFDIMTPKSHNAGFRLAERLHQINPRAVIIFTTNSIEYAENAFEISAYRYMLKPLNPQKVQAALDAVYSGSIKTGTNTFIFQGNQKTQVVIESDRILYLESLTSDHHAKIFLSDGTVIEVSLSKLNFSDLPELMLSPDFYQCHRCFIINLNHVIQFSNHFVTLKDHSEIPVSSKYKAGLINHMVNLYKKV